MHESIRRSNGIAAVLLTLLLCLGGTASAQDPDPKKAKFAALSRADTMIMVPMRDGVGLDTDVYLPKDGDGPRTQGHGCRWPRAPASDVKDTGFTVKLVDVHPDGTAFNVDDTILRARFREGYDKEVFMSPGQVYELKQTPMSTSYEFAAGHRIRVERASSKFPQYSGPEYRRQQLR